MKLDTEFIKLPLTFDVERMRAEVEAIPESDWRPHPQGHPGNSALPLIALNGDPTDDGVAGDDAADAAPGDAASTCARCWRASRPSSGARG